MKIKILTSFFVFALILGGCNSGGISIPGWNKDTSIPFINVRTGTDGLIMNFLPNSPPEKIYTSEGGEDFQIGLQILNKGAYSIKGGYVTASIERDYMELLKWNLAKNMQQIGGGREKISFDLEGKSQINPLGGQEITTLLAKAKELQKEEETHTSTVLVTGCYAYETEANADICIDTDIYNQKPTEKVCTVSDVSLTDQGAPIAITLIKVEMLPATEGFVRPQFTISVQNKGNGNAINKNKVGEACSAIPLERGDWNNVTVEEIKFSKFSLTGSEITCTPSSLRLESGQDSIKCTLNKNLLKTSAQSFKTSLYVKLGYGYTFTISKNVQISRILG